MVFDGPGRREAAGPHFGALSTKTIEAAN